MLLSLWTNYWDIWEQYHKVTFDGANRLILVNDGIEDINIKQDIYSDWKKWALMEDNSKWTPAFSIIGGEPLPGSKALGTTYFLINGWRIKPYEGNHALRVEGNIYTEEGESPFVNTIGDYKIRIESTVSSLVDSSFTQLAEIEQASFNNMIVVDQVNGSIGTQYPRGTLKLPLKNIADAIAVGRNRGINTFYFKGAATLDGTAELSGMILKGEGAMKTRLTITPYAKVDNCMIEECYVTGYLGFNNMLRRCMIENVEVQTGSIFETMIASSLIKFKAGTTGALHIINSFSGVPDHPAILDFAGADIALAVRNYTGGLRFQNKNDNNFTVIDLSSGRIFLDSTVTNGIFMVRGVGRLFDESVGATVDRSYLLEGDTLQATKAKVDKLKNPTLIIDNEIII